MSHCSDCIEGKNLNRDHRGQSSNDRGSIEHAAVRHEGTPEGTILSIHRSVYICGTDVQVSSLLI